MTDYSHPGNYSLGAYVENNFIDYMPIEWYPANQSVENLNDFVCKKCKAELVELEIDEDGICPDCGGELSCLKPKSDRQTKDIITDAFRDAFKNTYIDFSTIWSQQRNLQYVSIDGYSMANPDTFNIVNMPSYRPYGTSYTTNIISNISSETTIGGFTYDSIRTRDNPITPANTTAQIGWSGTIVG